MISQVWIIMDIDIEQSLFNQDLLKTESTSKPHDPLKRSICLCEIFHRLYNLKKEFSDDQGLS